MHVLGLFKATLYIVQYYQQYYILQCTYLYNCTMMCNAKFNYINYMYDLQNKLTVLILKTIFKFLQFL